MTIIDNLTYFTTITIKPESNVVRYIKNVASTNVYILGLSAANTVTTKILYPVTCVNIAVANSLINTYDPSWTEGTQ